MCIRDRPYPTRRCGSSAGASPMRAQGLGDRMAVGPAIRCNNPRDSQPAALACAAWAADAVAASARPWPACARPLWRSIPASAALAARQRPRAALDRARREYCGGRAGAAARETSRQTVRAWPAQRSGWLWYSENSPLRRRACIVRTRHNCRAGRELSLIHISYHTSVFTPYFFVKPSTRPSLCCQTRWIKSEVTPM